MANSNITKRAIAASFRQLLETTAFERVTVSAIAAGCGINRQTFYYHFHDIYDLIGWMIDDEVTTVLDEVRGDWRDSLVALLESLRKDRALALRRMRSADPVIMYHLLKDRLTSLVARAMGVYGVRDDVTPAERSLAADFLAGGLAEVIITWLDDDCATDPKEMVRRIERSVCDILPRLVSN